MKPLLNHDMSHFLHDCFLVYNLKNKHLLSNHDRTGPTAVGRPLSHLGAEGEELLLCAESDWPTSLVVFSHEELKYQLITPSGSCKATSN